MEACEIAKGSFKRARLVAVIKRSATGITARVEGYEDSLVYIAFADDLLIPAKFTI